MLSLELVQSFVVVAEELNFGRAAERLLVTQPPLSRRIQQLERDLGVELFIRSHRGIVLTPAGEAFLTDARRMLKLADEARANVLRVPGGDVGTVSVGFTAATTYDFLAPVIKLAAERLPGVDLVLREMVTDDQLQALHEGSLDLGLIRPPARGSDLISAPVGSEPMLAAVPSGWDLAAATELSVRDFDGRLLVMFDPSGARYFHDLVLTAFRSAAVTPSIAQYVTQIHTALALVRAEVGLALVPAAARALHYEGVRLLPVTDLAGFRAELEVCWRPDRSNPARDRLIRLLGVDPIALPAARPLGNEEECVSADLS
ncbi:MAG TPA: LysR family transcriptional regulator [Microlunatus sp.]